MIYKIIILRLPSDFLKKFKFLNLNTLLIKRIQHLAFPFPPISFPRHLKTRGTEIKLKRCLSFWVNCIRNPATPIIRSETRASFPSWYNSARDINTFMNAISFVAARRRGSEFNLVCFRKSYFNTDRHRLWSGDHRLEIVGED